ncbi:MAG: hypothetical protein JWN66_4822 [Sphingomonas bacterium]|uniref:TIGR04222 domain-containing membrane protein n=1 Tax=Sphingomonas bacterium TaxID=1895847 RepID=UPI0026323B6E|nr:TIGR04222 domain-containing membrane protein [Sphingomonas bacterium]MDB5707706.1 hypothetical protein [Sphingomonas bacterium]
MSLGPFDLTGGPFLQLYAILGAVALIAGWIIPYWLRPEGRAVEVTDAGELAYLAGGASRFADAVVARLLSARALVMIGKTGFHAQARDAGRTAAERSVLALPGEVRWPAIERSLKSHTAPIERELVSAGLMMDDGLIRQMRFWQTLPYLLLLGFGSIKWMIGVSRDRPVGFLTAFLIVTAVVALLRWAAVDKRTKGGIAALADARARAERLQRAPTTTETDLAVALFGTVVLAGSGWSDFHRFRTASSSDSGTSGDGGGSSDGGSGCGGGGGGGGGGCGGCGS